MKITFISDTHTKHHEITEDLIGGDLLLHCGDAMSSGYRESELIDFCEWFDNIDNYRCKIFIAGNHCRLFENNPERALEIVSRYKSIIYLQDSSYTYNDVNIYGSPWQPEFYNWAFNLQRNGMEIEYKWSMIPEDTDILLTHGPAYGILDTVEGKRHIHLGCEKLRERVDILKPSFHAFGHIHSGYGKVISDDVISINCSILDEGYDYVNKPINVEFYK